MSERIEKLLVELTLDEKAALVAGIDLWHGPGVHRLGIPALKVTDGPSGARGEQWSGRPSANFPCGSALGATWNPDLVREIGVRLGVETKRKNAHALLAPTVNIHRHPLAGRNFECYSEDPFLSARIAVGIHHRCAVAGCVVHGQALRRQRLRVRTDDHQLRGRRAHVARDLARAVRGRSHRSRHLGADDRVQQGQRHVHERARPAARDAAR